MRENLSPETRVYVHSFSGNVAASRRWLDAFPHTVFGFGLNAYHGAMRDVLKTLPINRILLESDAPHQMADPWCLDYYGSRDRTSNRPAAVVRVGTGRLERPGVLPSIRLVSTCSVELWLRSGWMSIPRYKPFQFSLGECMRVV